MIIKVNSLDSLISNSLNLNLILETEWKGLPKFIIYDMYIPVRKVNKASNTMNQSNKSHSDWSLLNFNSTKPIINNHNRIKTLPGESKSAFLI